MSYRERIIFHVLCIVYLIPVSSSNEIACRDENNQIVEWFIAYKFPHGFSYAYISPESLEWRLSQSNLTNDGFLRNTFDQVFKSTDTSVVYGMYNDEVPDHPLKSNEQWFGHMKGLFAFPENRTGFWLIHSVPKLSMNEHSFVYPDTSEHYAQHFLCVSMNYSVLPSIASQLAISRPLIQSYQLPEAIDKAIPVLQDVFAHRQKHDHPLDGVLDLETAYGGITMRHFSKSNRFHYDIYADIIASNLQQSLLSETWRHTSSNLPSDCTTDYWVLNIMGVKFPPSVGVSFSTLLDHSKWAVTKESLRENWLCLGDINRSKSQFSRGGGAMCIRDEKIWRLFRGIVDSLEPCPRPNASLPWTKLTPATRLTDL